MVYNVHSWSLYPEEDHGFMAIDYNLQVHSYFFNYLDHGSQFDKSKEYSMGLNCYGFGKTSLSEDSRSPKAK